MIHNMKEKRLEVNLLRSVCEEAKRKGKVTGSQLMKLSEIFGQRFIKAWEAVTDRRVKRYVFKPSGRVVWIVAVSYTHLTLPTTERV